RSGRLEIHRHAVDAIAQARRRRSIRKNVAEMAAATTAMHFRAHHAVALVVRGFDRSGFRVVEAWPAGATLEFLFGHEQRLPASGALEGAGAFLEIERAASRPLGAMTTHDVVLLGREHLPPFGVGMGYRKLRGSLGRRRAHAHPP